MIAFVHVAKTGGRTVEGMLRSSYGYRHCDATLLRPLQRTKPGEQQFTIPKYDAADVARIRDIMPRMRSLGGHHIALWSNVEKVFPSVQYLVMLRNPLKRGASHYQYHVQNDDYTELYGFKNFAWDEWVKWEVHHDHQLKMISPNLEVEEAIRLIGRDNTFVGLMENFDESLLLFRRLRAPDLNISYRRKNAAKDNSIARDLLDDPRCVEQIRQMYSREFPVYEYVKNELFPAYRREYGNSLAVDLEKYQANPARGVNNWNLAAYHLYRRLFFMPRIKKLRRSASNPALARGG